MSSTYNGPPTLASIPWPPLLLSFASLALPYPTLPCTEHLTDPFFNLKLSLILSTLPISSSLQLLSHFSLLLHLSLPSLVFPLTSSRSHLLSYVVLSCLILSYLIYCLFSPLTGAEDLLTKSGDLVHFSQLLPHDAGGNMKAPRGQKSTTVSVGDGPPRIVPVDKEDEYISGLLISLTSPHPIPHSDLVTIRNVLFFCPNRAFHDATFLFFTVSHFSFLFFRYGIQHG